ncbi:hypothetical protein B0H67DRAFT_676190 [Lasiosphaeris hirsuta]|uniref:Uncharacterized protein n=1 Tax=Lasiosphaeris hirsuta TaxID=260670 RepID=A0AA39ZR43_9PEZI|nr:hypothetical protein B0H67DRAFT_676190 [Lasiosphaeris hirsuta]
MGFLFTATLALFCPRVSHHPVMKSTGHPGLFASSGKWADLPNRTIFHQATRALAKPTPSYTIDGTSGVLDVAREIQLRIKQCRYFGTPGDNWNSDHWPDVGEFIVAFSYAYDWLYDAWSAAQGDALMWSIIDLGLRKGQASYERNVTGFSPSREIGILTGRHTALGVTNGAMIIGALAVYHEDPTNSSRHLLPRAIQNAVENCAQSVESDGTWSETPDYWSHGMLSASPAFKGTGIFHIYIYGMTEKFNYGDCGPKEYNPNVTGSWYYDLPLDSDFSDPHGAWVSMRSSWTSPFGIFVVMKAGQMTGHATHGNLDAGDFVLNVLGERWAEELCQDDYSVPGYFSSEGQQRQNTILHGGRNEIADAVPNTLIIRGLRLLKIRKQVLVQDEITSASQPSQWRMHTKAAITYSLNGKRARMAFFHTTSAARLTSDSPLPEGYMEMANTDVKVVAINPPMGNSTVAVLICPLWEPALSCTTTPPIVPVQEWG